MKEYCETCKYFRKFYTVGSMIEINYYCRKFEKIVFNRAELACKKYKEKEND